jgi:hypothetical protein
MNVRSSWLRKIGVGIFIRLSDLWEFFTNVKTSYQLASV